MQASDIPTKFQIPWGNSAGGGFIRPIPQASQIGVQGGAASLTDGFPPLTFTPVGAGGLPPFGQDFNGILNQVTEWSRWQSAGGLAFYDSVFSAAISGYPKGAMLAGTTAGVVWLSTVDNNTSDPDTGGANWVQFALVNNVQLVQPGSLFDFAGPSGNVPSGYLLCFGQSVLRTDYPALFSAIGTVWGSVDGTHFTIPDFRGRIAAGADAMGGTPANRLTNQSTGGSAGALGNVGGEQSHQLITAELAAHTHNAQTSTTGGGLGAYVSSTLLNSAGSDIVTKSTGGDTAHNNVQPTAVVNKIIKT